ncbi:transposase [Salmonella enterica subsp. enterica serovar Offa]
MRKARFTEHQIIAVLKSVEAGRTAKDVSHSERLSPKPYHY